MPSDLKRRKNSKRKSVNTKKPQPSSLKLVDYSRALLVELSLRKEKVRVKVRLNTKKSQLMPPV
jgi:hypothetical protein